MTIQLQTGAYLVQSAYEDAGMLTIGGTPTPAMTTRGLNRVNDLINLWATQGLKLWLQEDVPVPLTTNKTTYSMGPGGDVNMTKPLSILQGYYVTSTSVRQPLVPLSRDEWTRLASTTTAGALNSYFTDKQLSFLYVSFYNTPDATAATGTAHLITRTAASNFVLSSDTIGLPPEWYIALRWALADELATAQPVEVQNRCSQRAGAYRTALEGFDVEDAVTFFQPDTRTQYSGGKFT